MKYKSIIKSETKFNGAYSRNNLPKIMYWRYVINVDEYKSIETHWIAFYVNCNSRRVSYNAIYLDSSEAEHIPEENKNFIENKNIIRNIFRIQDYSFIMCRYFCIGIVDFKLKSKRLLDYTNLLSPNEYKMNDKIILQYFQ